MAKKAKVILEVSICEAKPNKLFTEEERAWVRFLIYNQRIPCVECGRKVKKMWTMLCQFTCLNMDKLVAHEGKKSHPPLTPVCDEHPLAPDFPKDE